MIPSAPSLNALASLLVAIALLNVAIGISVLRRNPTAPLNRAFACTAFAVALWTAALAFRPIPPLIVKAEYSVGHRNHANVPEGFATSVSLLF